MADLTRSEYRARVRTLLNELTPSLYKDTEINDWLNDGQRDVAIKARCIESAPQTLTLVGSTQAYSFTGVDPVAVVFGTRSLVRITPKQYGHIRENGTDPQYYWVWNSQVYIVPTPSTSGSASLYAAGLADDMDYDEDTSNLPVPFRDLIVLYATYRGLLKAAKYQQAQSIYSIYIKELGFHQTNDSKAYEQPDDMSEREVPNKYVQVKGTQAK